MIIAAPVLLAPPLVHDSFWIDYVWSSRFIDELRGGTLYPRWLSGSFDGLGAPVFYFYAPLPFYVVGVLGLGGLGAYPALMTAFVAALAGSGGAMHAWLDDRRTGLFGAVLYMALPYHLLDFARRGAIGEFFAAAFLPLVAIGIVRATSRRGISVLAISYAGLVLSHLPTALLATVVLIGPYTLYRSRSSLASLLPAAGGVLLGAGLASAYLLPALMLQPASNMTALWITGFTPEDWSLFHPGRWPSAAEMIIIIVISAAIAVPAIFALWARPNIWAALAIACTALALGLLPGFWSLPLLAKVQFPWRILTIAEFAFATLVACHIPAWRWRLAAIAPAVALSWPIMFSGFPAGHPTLAELDAKRPEVLEYLPAGTRFTSIEAVLAFAAATPERRVADGIVTVRRFYFPRWEVRCGARVVPGFAQPQSGLLAFRGTADCTIRSRMLPVELAGLILSGLSLLLLALSVVAQSKNSLVTCPILRPDRAWPLP